MKKIMHNLSSPLRFALCGGVIALIVSSVAFTQIDQAHADTKATPVRLVVDEAPVKREGKFTTSFSPVVKKVAPSVVNVFTTTAARNVPNARSPLLDDPFFRRFFGDNPEGGRPGRNPRSPKQHGLGSGVVVTKDGYILTNNHVVENADEVKVAFTNGKEFTAKVIGKDAKTDIAVLKIDAKDLPFLQIANSDYTEVGDVVLAVGNPFGVGQTVTMGIVSALGRGNVGLDYEDFIQTDAAINPGNSGGPLVDGEGRLIGINTAIISRSGGNQGIGFAVPINLARNVMESLIQNGRVVRGFLGVSIQDINPSLAKEFNLKESAGALVGEVTARSPAEKAGLKSGDVILEFNGKPVRNSRNLKLQVAQTAPSAKVPVKIIRDGTTKTLEVVLKEIPRSEMAENSGQGEAPSSDTLDGVTVGDIDSTAKSQLKIPSTLKGALVMNVDPNSPSYEAGLREGDIIQEINRKPVANADEAVSLSEKTKEGKVLLRVWSKGGSRYLVVDESKAG